MDNAFSCTPNLSDHITYFIGGGQWLSILNSAWFGYIAKESHNAT
jgi:hypothetical protein